MAADNQESVVEQVIQRGVLRVGMSTFVPWAMKDKTGKLIGFEIDVATRLAQDMGVPVEQLPPEYQARFNIAPTTDHLIVTTDREEREVKVARWGLINHWAKDAKTGYKQINARSETVEKSPACPATPSPPSWSWKPS